MSRTHAARARAGALRRRLQGPPPPASPLADLRPALRGLDDDGWLQVLIASLDEPRQRGVVLPGFPPAAVQERFVGASGPRALAEASAFHRVATSAVADHGRPLGGDDARVLDLGAGWGRISRFFARDVPGSGIYGLDVLTESVELCRTKGCPGTYLLVDELPPTLLADGGFDLVTAYSVFSHLSARAADAWIAELARLLRPGGLIVATTRSPTFLDYLASLRGVAEVAPHDAYLLAAFGDLDALRARYDAGEHVFAAVGSAGDGSSAEVYGEAFVPRAHVERAWAVDGLELVSFTDDVAVLPQAVVVLRRT